MSKFLNTSEFIVMINSRGFLHACIFWYCDNFCAFFLYFNPIECLVCSRVSTTQTTTISKSGVLKSYDYPSKYIRGKVECYWPIVAGNNQIIRLTVQTLDVHGCKRCGNLQVWFSRFQECKELYIVQYFTTTSLEIDVK
jgi:hypothetical protein